jgi:hypothetical protein
VLERHGGKWAIQDSNLGPLPYQPSEGRAASAIRRPIPRSRAKSGARLPRGAGRSLGTVRLWCALGVGATVLAQRGPGPLDRPISEGGRRRPEECVSTGRQAAASAVLLTPTTAGASRKTPLILVGDAHSGEPLRGGASSAAGASLDSRVPSACLACARMSSASEISLRISRSCCSGLLALVATERPVYAHACASPPERPLGVGAGEDASEASARGRRAAAKPPP